MSVPVKTLIDRSTRNMGSGIHPVVKESAIEVIERAYKEGIRVQISEGFRSYARQNQLYAQGRTASGNVVTNAKGGQSYHNFGLAVDYFLVSKDGNTALWKVNNEWKRVAAIAKSLGFEWGGDWKSFKDYPHLQMTGGLSLSQLRAGKKPSLKSKVSNSTKSNNGKLNKASLDVDGKWGKATTKAVQIALNTTVDSIISDQLRTVITQAMYGNTVQYGKGNKGSQMVKALQGTLGRKQDGLLGPDTIEGLQIYLGMSVVDCKLSRPSAVVKEMQCRLNAGIFV
ncbi:M15 family metallopeptidase [Oceanobacillus sp. E9]|uniref:M15 family metallopeptidase n=1 Tax=Oceanobacillus sp. E9 TaxID=1742575 RepID=UPI00084E7D03|nr:M15 family metallopeptidase [Oceanobacillus sp. E9]